MLRSLWRDIPCERRRLIVIMAILAGVILLLDFCGRMADLYQTDYFGYDKIVHGVAGAFCGTFGLWLFQPSEATKELPYALMTVALFAFWIGLGWEVYEVMFNEPDLNMLWFGDTATDLVADVIGGISAGLVYREKR